MINTSWEILIRGRIIRASRDLPIWECNYKARDSWVLNRQMKSFHQSGSNQMTTIGTKMKALLSHHRTEKSKGQASYHKLLE